MVRLSVFVEFFSTSRHEEFPPAPVSVASDPSVPNPNGLGPFSATWEVAREQLSPLSEHRQNVDSFFSVPTRNGFSVRSGRGAPLVVEPPTPALPSPPAFDAVATAGVFHRIVQHLLQRTAVRVQ